MPINFMHELDNTKRLEDLLDNPDHIKRMSDVNPHADYSNWKDKASVVKLMNVKWNADEHVVLWESEEQRDEWFDKQSDGCVTYNTNWNLLNLENFAPSLGTYEGNIKVPLPLEQALGFNYIMIDRYQQPVEDYDNAPVRSRFFFFITGVEKKPASPNNTSLIIELDAWTEYTFEGFESMAGDLKRGHWAMDKITTEEYLADPLDSKINLFEPEPTLPDVKSKVSYEKLTTPYNDPVVVIASTMDFANDTGYLDNQKHTPDMNYWWLNYKDDKYKNKYSDVSNLDMSYLASIDPKYSDDKSPYDVDDGRPLGRATRKTINDNDQNITSIFYYILELDEFENFIVMLRRRYPQIYTTLVAMFVLPRNYILQGDKFMSTFDIPMQYAHQQNNYRDEFDMKLSPDMFGFDTDFTKLYTEQFSQLEISNLNGERTKLNIEDTSGTLSFLFRANIMFPFLKFEGLLNGIGGSMINTYKLSPLHEDEYQMFLSNWEDYKFEWDIPTYGIYADAKSLSFELGQKLQRDYAFAKLDYDNTMVDIDKMHANTFNDLETSFKTGTNSANTTRDNGNASNDTALANALASAETAKENSQESATNTKTTADESAETDKDTSLRSIDNSKTTSDESNDTSQQTSIRSINNTKSTSDRSVTNDADNADAGISHTQNVWQANDTQLGNMSNLTIAANAAGVVAGILFTTSNDGKDTSGTPTGGGGDAIGAINKAGLAAISGITTAGKTQINSTNMKAIRDADEGQQSTVKTNNYTTGTANNAANQTTDTANTNQQHDTQATINAQNQSTDTANTNQQYATTTTINAQNYATAVDILNRTYATSVANANRSHDTTAANIVRSYDTTTTNLNLDLNKGLKNLDNEIKAATNDADVAYNKKLAQMELELTQALDGDVRAITQNSGNGSLDAWGRRGIDVRINRINKADENVVVNEFKRYGYQMPVNTWIQSPDFKPISSSYGKRDYSYWQFRDIYAWSTKMSETSRRVIMDILKRGVTIWDSPDNVQQGFLQ